MPRYRRLFLPDIPVHAVQRGHDRQPVFVEHEDYLYYLSNLVEAKETYGIRVYSYCLMTNHVHLLLCPGEQADAVSALMRVVAARQTRYVNRKESRTGTLWEGRFKASLVDSGQYFLACCRYIELNPVRAGIVSDPGKYAWSSYVHNAGISNVSWLDHHPEFELSGYAGRDRQTVYRAFVNAGISTAERDVIRTAVRRNQVTGNDRFRDAIARRTGRRLSTAAPGRPKQERK